MLDGLVTLEYRGLLGPQAPACAELAQCADQNRTDRPFPRAGSAAAESLRAGAELAFLIAGGK